MRTQRIFSFLLLCLAFTGHHYLGCTPVPTQESTTERSESLVDASGTDVTEAHHEQSIQDGACESGESRACYTGPSHTRDKGICKSGLEICKDGVWSLCTKEILPQAKDDCDGKDNDCDGDIDEDCTCKDGDTQSCYPFPTGCTQSNGSFQCSAPCKAGTQKCTNNQWSACTDAIQPTTEKCNGKDDDCDGKVDNNLTAPLCKQQKGACKGKTKICEGQKGWKTCDKAAYGSTYEAKEVTCDGIDNDCDGQIDNGLKAPLCSAQLGICKGKVRICEGAKGWTICEAKAFGPDYEPTETRCDGKDNDCDGQIDNKLKAPKCPKQAGMCKDSLQRCGGVKGWLPCTALEYGPKYEAKEVTCDGLDNDCDRTVDNIANPPLCNNQKGVCKGKVKSCGSAQGWQTCTASELGKEYQAMETRCDQKDNDCDGRIDILCTDTLAGLSGTSGSTDHPTDPTKARFNAPEAIAFHQNKLYIADTLNSSIRIFDTIQKSTKVLSLTSTLTFPKGIAVDKAGVIYISNTNSHTILKINPATSTTTVFGKSGTSGSADGIASQARFNAPQGLALDASGHLYVADTKNHTIRKIDPQGNVTTFAGQANQSGKTDHATDPKKAQFKFPEALAVYKKTLYIADTFNNSIRKINLTSKATTTLSITTSLDNPKGIAVDALGYIYVSDSNNNTLRVIAPNNAVRTLAGQKLSGKKDEWSNKASFNAPQGLALDTSASWLYIVDTDNHSIRRIKLK